MKEQQFIRQIHKVEADARKEAARLQERHDSNLSSKTREFERTIEELEERLNRQQDENEDLRRKVDRLERTSWEHR